MGGAQQPFLFAGESYDDAKFPIPKFDPKAVTRASYEAKPRKSRPEGPLVSVNRHPDAHMVPSQRSMSVKPMSRRLKGWIKGIRVVQLVLRVFELVGGLGVLVLMILLSNVDSMVAWVLRITGGVVAMNCIYSILHLSRPAGSKTPGSSAAYHTFAGISDLCVLPLYAYGALNVRQNGSQWTTVLSDQSVVEAFVPAFYYTLISAGGLHVVSLTVSLWLGVMFRRISCLPPDMNPLESNLTSRAHKRNKSSMAVSTYSEESSKRLSTPLEDYRRSGAPYETLSRPPSVPFMHTRQSSEATLRPSTRDSRAGLPSRQYHINPYDSPRGSRTSVDTNPMSATPPRTANRGSYAEIPSYNFNPRLDLDLDLDSVPSYRASQADASAVAAQPRSAKFSETWYASDSLINRTQERNRAMKQAYEAVNTRYNDNDGDDSDSESELPTGQHNKTVKTGPIHSYDPSGIFTDPADDSDPGLSLSHPNPLRSNPSLVSDTSMRSSVLKEVNLNDRRVSGTSVQDIDIADQKAGGLHGNTLRPDAFEPRNRMSSIQPESEFYSKPYGELNARTPPLMEPPLPNARRQVSSGIDYFEQLTNSGGKFGRRNVSGKIAEEGRAGGGSPWSRRQEVYD